MNWLTIRFSYLIVQTQSNGAYNSAHNEYTAQHERETPQLR